MRDPGAAQSLPTQAQFASLLPGDACPWLAQRTGGKDRFHADTLAGRYVLFCFVLTASDQQGKQAVDALMRHRAMFDDRFASAFVVSIDPDDEREARFKDHTPGLRAMWDLDHSVSRRCGALAAEEPEGGPETAQRFWLLVDPTHHVLARFPFRLDDPEHRAVFDVLERLPPPGRFGGLEIPAPILVLPNVFEPSFCRTLIEAYETHGGEDSGVVRNGAGVLDHGFKRRRDHVLQDRGLITGGMARLKRRVAPEIEKLFFMKTSRIERHIVACYSAEEGGYFLPHRDNNQGITQHRRFAVSINLNDDFEGGEVAFPETSLRGYKAPAGWAVVFPCALLHSVRPVTKGRRYAYLPFLYDEAGAALRIWRQEPSAPEPLA